MLTGLGHEVYHYGAGNPPCTENIEVVTGELQRKTYKLASGDDYSPENFFWVPKSFSDAVYSTFRENTIRNLNARKQAKDILLAIPGEYHRAIIDKVNMITVEPAVGNEHPVAEFRVFPSYAWMHYIYGHQGSPAIYHGKPYDAVIPHYFDIDDFNYNEAKDNYFLYIGRVVFEKGVHLASEVCNKLGIKLIVAGRVKDQSYLKQLSVEYIGVVNIERRRELLSKARAFISPTLYIEPFGMPVVEALFSGTPVITTDWGSFTEIVSDEVGFRCRTRNDFIQAAQNVDKILPIKCRAYAMNYSLDDIAPKYQEYFTKLQAGDNKWQS